MLASREYHYGMDLASSKAFARAVILALALAPAAGAQIHGAPASVTSLGFGGHDNPTPGVPASVTSLGPNGYQGGVRFFSSPNTGRPSHNPSGGHRSNGGYFYPAYVPVYAMPYTIMDQPVGDTAPELPQDEYRGGPTIFDRRGPGPSRTPENVYPERTRSESREPVEQASTSQAPAAPEPDRPQTLLMFKDGHQLEVQNYAIVGDTLYDLTPGRHHKIALSELDIKATVRENDDRGIDFRLPPNAQAE